MKPSLLAVFAAAALQALVTVSAQEPPQPAAAPPLPPAFSAVSRAWLVPERDFNQVASSPLSLGEFAVAAMISHASGKPLSEVQETKRKLGSWAEVIKTEGGDLADVVFKGSARYGFEPLPQTIPGGDSADAGQRITELAKVMTLERLTGKAPSSIARELKEGKEFEALLAAAMPNPEINNRKPEHEGPDKGHGREKGPPGMDLGLPSQRNHGNVGSGLGH